MPLRSSSSPFRPIVAQSSKCRGSAGKWSGDRSIKFDNIKLAPGDRDRAPPLPPWLSKKVMLRFEPDQYGNGFLPLSCMLTRKMPAARETLGGLAMSYKLALAGAVFAGAVIIGASAASAITYDIGSHL